MNPSISERLRKFRDNQKQPSQEVVVVGRSKQHGQTIQRYANKLGIDLAAVPPTNLRQSAELRRSVEDRLSSLPLTEEKDDWVSEIASLLKKSSPRFELPPPPAPAVRVENIEKPLEALEISTVTDSHKDFFVSLISRLRGSADLEISRISEDDDGAFERIKTRLFGPEKIHREIATETEVAQSVEIPSVEIPIEKIPSPADSISWQVTDEIQPIQSSLELSKSDILTAQMISDTAQMVNFGVQDDRRVMRMESSMFVFFEAPEMVGASAQTEERLAVSSTAQTTTDVNRHHHLVKPPQHVKVAKRAVKVEEAPLPDYLHPINWIHAAEKEYLAQKTSLLRKVYDRSVTVTN